MSLKIISTGALFALGQKLLELVLDVFSSSEDEEDDIIELEDDEYEVLN